MFNEKVDLKADYKSSIDDPKFKSLVNKLDEFITELRSNKVMTYKDFLDVNGKTSQSYDYSMSALEAKTFTVQVGEYVIFNDAEVYTDDVAQIEFKLSGQTLFKKPFLQGIDLSNYLNMCKFPPNSRIEIVITDLSNDVNRLTLNLSYYKIGAFELEKYLNRK